MSEVRSPGLHLREDEGYEEVTAGGKQPTWVGAGGSSPLRAGLLLWAADRVLHLVVEHMKTVELTLRNFKYWRGSRCRLCGHEFEIDDTIIVTSSSRKSRTFCEDHYYTEAKTPIEVGESDE